jgi:catechol 2,3-dioxygenase-like lactoylglutathione lyase family enzyme
MAKSNNNKEEKHMIVKTIDHITINVKDLEKTFSFYESILGLQRLDFTMDLGFGVIYYMELPGGTKLELINYRTDEHSLYTKDTDLGIYRHVAFTVDSLDEIKERCMKWGAKINLEKDYNKFLNCYVMLVADPNGVEVEFVENVK